MGGSTYTKSAVGAGELAVYRLLARLAPRHKHHFAVLQLPVAIAIDVERHRLVLPRYEGEELAQRWHEADGGRSLGVGLAARIAVVLEDLAQIDTVRLTDDPEFMKISAVAFDHAGAHSRSLSISHRLTAAGLLSPQDGMRTERLLEHQQQSPMILNNGDFYPRNLIVLPTGRIVIIDWETYNPNSPFHTIDHLENVAAVFYVHMWGHPAWQAAFADALHDRFDFSEMDFAKGVVIQGLELANMWMGDPATLPLAAIQASMVNAALAKAQRR
ncbi:MAG: hypothetical protein ACREN1_02255 [Candidatus Dormibacteria bacterium]